MEAGGRAAYHAVRKAAPAAVSDSDFLELAEKVSTKVDQLVTSVVYLCIQTWRSHWVV